MRALAKILRARAREHSSNFCEQLEQRQNFASTFKLDGTILYPYRLAAGSLNQKKKKNQINSVWLFEKRTKDSEI